MRQCLSEFVRGLVIVVDDALSRSEVRRRSRALSTENLQGLDLVRDWVERCATVTHQHIEAAPVVLGILNALAILLDQGLAASRIVVRQRSVHRLVLVGLNVDFRLYDRSGRNPVEFLLLVLSLLPENRV